MNIAMLGPQGCGKGTQAELLVNEFGMVRVETGKILREIAATSDPRALDIKTIMQEGRLVPDEILLEVIKRELVQRNGNGFVLDGTPRDVPQYKLIKELLISLEQKLDYVVFLDISEEESIVRISNRRTCEKCNRIYNLLTDSPPYPDTCECGGRLAQREDDTPAAISKRLEAYRTLTLPVLKKAEEDEILVKIDGSQKIDTIHDEIVKKLDLRHG
jgi:adenylate kinase